MRIKALRLFSNSLDAEKDFYVNKFGFDLLEESEQHFTVIVGWTKLIFHYSEKQHLYHYCFLIPANKLLEAMSWVEKRVPIYEIEEGRKTQVFDSWNAESFYFFDASGNLAECIVRHDLKNETDLPFDVSQILCVNEIGLPTNNIGETNTKLNQLFQTEFWKGDKKRFGTNGDDKGLFLLPNYEVKDVWFPSEQKIIREAFEISIEQNGVERYCTF